MWAKAAMDIKNILEGLAQPCQHGWRGVAYPAVIAVPAAHPAACNLGDYLGTKAI